MADGRHALLGLFAGWSSVADGAVLLRRQMGAAHPPSARGYEPHFVAFGTHVSAHPDLHEEDLSVGAIQQSVTGRAGSEPRPSRQSSGACAQLEAPHA